MITNLKWWRAPTANLSVTPYGLLRISPTGLFDMEPVAGTTQPPGFSQFSLFYGSYRVLSSKIKLEAWCGDANSMIKMTVFPMNLDPGASPTATFFTSAPEQPYARSVPISAGGPPRKIVHDMSTQKMFGSAMTRFDDNFSSLVTGNPNNNWYWIVSWYNAATISSTTALIMNVSVEMEVEFFDRLVLLRTSSPEPDSKRKTPWDNPSDIFKRSSSDLFEPLEMITVPYEEMQLSVRNRGLALTMEELVPKNKSNAGEGLNVRNRGPPAEMPPQPPTTYGGGGPNGWFVDPNQMFTRGRGQLG
jgi:hypothetical protein